MKQSVDGQHPGPDVIESPAPAPRYIRAPNNLVSRITVVLGLLFLALGFFLWFVRNGHYRLILLVLTAAMFMAVLHTYTFENGGK